MDTSCALQIDQSPQREAIALPPIHGQIRGSFVNTVDVKTMGVMKDRSLTEQGVDFLRRLEARMKDFPFARVVPHPLRAASAAQSLPTQIEKSHRRCSPQYRMYMNEREH